MTLNPHPSYPSLGSYVLKLHRDAQPQQGDLRGHIEHITSGDSFDFGDARALVAQLAQHAAAQRAAAAQAALPGPVLVGTAAPARGRETETNPTAGDRP